uniref:Insulin-like androgenic gland hormone n=1 Tax=Eriocheir sinensis TaxID=95602 RepID=A0A2P1CYH6_ERISI|nr:insulin-like androgenic gland hormone [Eriocheir sinensis]
MSLPSVLLLMLLTATATRAQDCSFSVDCANLLDSMNTVCRSYKQHPGYRRTRDTFSVGMIGNTSSAPADTALQPPAAAVEMLDEENPMLPPQVAARVFQMDRVGGRFRRSERTVDAYTQCCVENCTLHEVAGYCETFQPEYQFLATGNPCA